MTLEGKTALVLGGSRGIGAAIVERLVRDGAKTTFTYAGSREAAEALAQKTGATARQADSADRKAVSDLIAGLEHLDILIINAGVLVLGDPREIDANAVDHMIDVNIRGPYHAAVAAGKKMKDGGRIVVIGSVNGDRVPFGGAAAYAMTKSAMQGLVRGLARLRAVRHHGQQRAARAGRYRHEPGRRPDEGPDALVHGHQAPRAPGRDRRHGGLSRRPRGRHGHRRAAYHRRRRRGLKRTWPALLLQRHLELQLAADAGRLGLVDVVDRGGNAE